ADCAMTAADRTCPRARAARGGERHCHIKAPSTALYFRRKQHEVCCARTGTGTGGNHQEYAVLA
ncbi:terminase, partial [Escherichia coli]